MWLLSTARAELHYFNDPPTDTEPYAIFSHVWQSAEDTHRDLQDLRGVCSVSGRNPRDHVSEKVKNCCLTAEADGFKWVWIDTCCIDKSSSAELSEAINSMYAWYARAAVCYAYLQDVVEVDIATVEGRTAFSRSRWFTRGWTLQELLAPHSLVFLSTHWDVIGTKAEREVADLVQTITGVAPGVLDSTRRLDEVSIACRMSWASRRTTTRIEDRAYSLMGIFDVNMPIIYGEGDQAFFRLQMEIIRQSPDQSIFAWGIPDSVATLPSIDSIFSAPLKPGHARDESIFAPSPTEFANSSRMQPIPISELARALQILPERPQFIDTSYGIHTLLPMTDVVDGILAVGALACRDSARGVLVGLLMFQLHPDEPWHTCTMCRVVLIPDKSVHHTSLSLSMEQRKLTWKEVYLARRRSSSIGPPILQSNHSDYPVTVPGWYFIDPGSLAELRGVGWAFSWVILRGRNNPPTSTVHQVRFLEMPTVDQPQVNVIIGSHQQSRQRFAVCFAGCLSRMPQHKTSLWSTVVLTDSGDPDSLMINDVHLPASDAGLIRPTQCSSSDAHVQSWPDHSKEFGDAERNVRVTFENWGPVKLGIYVIKIQLGGGVYETCHANRSGRHAVTAPIHANELGLVPHIEPHLESSGNDQERTRGNRQEFRNSAPEDLTRTTERGVASHRVYKWTSWLLHKSKVEH
jgi:hypothetical protein